MRSTVIRAAAGIAAVELLLLVGAAAATLSRHVSTAEIRRSKRGWACTCWRYLKSGTIAVSHGGAQFQIRERAENPEEISSSSTKQHGTKWTLSGKGPLWASFQLTLTASSPEVTAKMHPVTLSSAWR